MGNKKKMTKNEEDGEESGGGFAIRVNVSINV
jgi:hypothetical protein